MCEHPQQTRQPVEPFNIGDVAHVAPHDGVHVVARPRLTPALIFAPEHLGVSASYHGADEVGAGHSVAGSNEFSFKRALEKRRFRAAHFGHGERQQADHCHAPGETFGYLRQREHVCRSGQQKTSGAAIFIDRPLDGAQEFRRPLHLVDDDPVKATHQPRRVAAGGLQNGVVVQRQIGASGAG